MFAANASSRLANVGGVGFGLAGEEGTNAEHRERI